MIDKDEKIIIRTAMKEDYDQLRLIFFRTRKEDFIWVDVNTVKIGDFDNVVEGELILVACIKNQVVGFVSIWEEDNFIHNLFVDSEFRRYGIGKALLNESIKIAGKPMTLKCVKQNEKALKFYLSQGWKIEREEMDSEGPYYVICSNHSLQ